MEAKVNDIAEVVYLRLNVHFKAKKTNEGSELNQKHTSSYLPCWGETKQNNNINYIKWEAKEMQEGVL